MNAAKLILEQSTLKGKKFSIKRAALPKHMRPNEQAQKAPQMPLMNDFTEDPSQADVVISNSKTVLEAVAPYAEFHTFLFLYLFAYFSLYKHPIRTTTYSKETGLHPNPSKHCCCCEERKTS